MKKTLFLAAVLGACVNAGAYEYIKGNQTWDETTPDFTSTTHIGYAEGAGTVTAVTDADVTVNGTLFVGGKGWDISTPKGNNGTLTIESDAFVTAKGGDGYSSLAVGASDYAIKGTVNILNGGTLIAEDGMQVGSGTQPSDTSKGVGSIVIEENGMLAVTQGEVLIGTYTTGSGSVLVKKGGELVLGPSVTGVWVGQNGKGTLTIEGDVTNASTAPTSLYVGSGANGSTGTVNVAADSSLQIGGEVIVEKGGKLNAADGSELEIGKSLTASSNGAELKLSGATVNVAENVNMVDGAKITIDKGTEVNSAATVVDNASVVIADSTVNSDVVNLHHGAEVGMKNGAVIDAGDVKLHDDAALTVADAEVKADSISIADGSLTAENADSKITSDTMSVLSGGLLDVQDGGHVLTTNTAVVESGATVRLVDDAEWHVGDSLTGTMDIESGSTIIFGVTNKHIDDSGVVGTGHIEVADGGTVNVSTSSNLVVDVHAEVIQRMLNGETELAINLVTSETPGAGTVNVGSGSEDANISVNGAGLDDIADVFDQIKGDKLQIRVHANEEKLAELVAPDADAVATTMLADANALGTYANAIMAQVKMPRQGDHRLWGVGLADFERVTTKGNASGYRYNGGGYCVGYDQDVAKDTYLGVTAGQMYGVYQSKRSTLHDRQVATMAGVYGHTDWDAGKSGDNKVNLDGYALYGRIHHKAHTSVYGALPASGSWDSDAVKAGLFLSYDFNVDENTTITPFIGLTVTHITQDDVSLKSAKLGYTYTDGDYTNVTLPVGVTYTKTYDLGHGSSLVPHISLAYLGDIYRDDVSVKTKVIGKEERMYGVKPGRSGVMAEIGSSWVINPQWTTGLFYTMEHRRHDTDHTIHAHVSYGF